MSEHRPAPSWIAELAERAEVLAELATWWALEPEVVEVDQLEAAYAYLAPHVEASSGLDVPPAFSPRWHALAPDDPLRQTSLILSAFARWADEHDLAAPCPRIMVETSHDVAAALSDQRRQDHERWAAHAEAERAAEAEWFRLASKAWDRFLTRRRHRGRAAAREGAA